MHKRVPYVNLAAQNKLLKAELLKAVENVLDHGMFILGDEVGAFETKFAEYCGTRFAIGVANGTDALVLALKALGIGPGDEVITAPNSFLASTSAIILAGARPVFVDVRDDFNIDPNLIESAISPRTKAILPIHLTGRPADMLPILDIARRHNLLVVEDCAQAVGASCNGQRVGTFGNVGCFSLHPLKNLSACGDGGIITTNDEGLRARLIKARNHGLRNRDECDFWSINSRLDTVQAAILNVKIAHLDRWTAQRRANAAFYQKRLGDVVQVPTEREQEFSVYHLFVIQADDRDSLREHLRERSIDTGVHYPIPIHLQEAARSLGYSEGDFPVTEKQARRILSLPIYPELTQEQREQVVNAVREFYGR